MTVRITGLNRVVRGLEQVGLEVTDLKDAFSEVARMGARTAAALAPKRSGRLAGDVRGNRAKSKAVVAAGRKSVPYAGVQNYGWPKRNIRATHFMQRADKAVAPFALRRLQVEIDKQIRKRGLD